MESSVIAEIAVRARKIQARDQRIIIESGFPNRSLARDDTYKLLGHLENMVTTVADVEKQFQLKFGIGERFPKIEVVLPQPSFHNRAYIKINPVRVVYSLGAPWEYDSFFARLGAIHAHETGHLISFFSAPGSLRYRSEARRREVDLGYLTRNGYVPFHYLTGVNFRLFPLGLLKDTRSDAAYYWLNELIANRVEEKVIGTEIDRPVITEDVQGSKAGMNPWVHLFHLVMADIHGLKKEATLLRRRISGSCLPWLRWLPTNDLRERMAEFYRGIEIAVSK